MRRTVVIVDDHDAFRVAARALLEAEGFSVVGEAAALTVLLGASLSFLGFAVAEQLPANGPVVVLTSSRDGASFRRRLAATNWPFVAKGELSGEALAAAVAR